MSTCDIAMWLELLKAWWMSIWRACPKNEHFKRKWKLLGHIRDVPGIGSITSTRFFWSKQSGNPPRFNRVDCSLDREEARSEISMWDGRYCHGHPLKNTDRGRHCAGDTKMMIPGPYFLTPYGAAAGAGR